jgi:hypothetical protein
MLDAGRRAAASYADIQFECLQRVDSVEEVGDEAVDPLAPKRLD